MARIHWNSPKRRDEICQKAIDIIEDILDDPGNEKVCDGARKLATTILTNMAYPILREPSININVLTSEALLEAKRKAGLLAPVVEVVKDEEKQEVSEKKE